MPIERLRRQRREALRAARECHPADIGTFVALARAAHQRIMAARPRDLDQVRMWNGFGHVPLVTLLPVIDAPTVARECSI